MSLAPPISRRHKSPSRQNAQQYRKPIKKPRRQNPPAKPIRPEFIDMFWYLIKLFPAGRSEWPVPGRAFELHMNAKKVQRDAAPLGSMLCAPHARESNTAVHKTHAGTHKSVSHSCMCARVCVCASACERARSHCEVPTLNPPPTPIQPFASPRVRN